MRGLLSLASLLRVFQLESRRQHNEMQALAPGSIHPRVNFTTVAMTIGALMALGGFFSYPLLFAIGTVICAAALLAVVIQAIIDVIRSG